MTKENEKRERTKESKEKEDTSSAHAARAREELFFDKLYDAALSAIEIAGKEHKPPHPRQVISMATAIMGLSREFALRWYADMTQQYWCDLDNNPIRNWAFMLRSWSRGDAYYAAKQRLLASEAERMTTLVARGGSRSGSPRKSDNWRGTNPKEVGDVLG